MLGPFSRRSSPKAPAGKGDVELGRLRKDVNQIHRRVHGLERQVGELTAVLTSQHQDLLDQLRPDRAAEPTPLPPLPSIVKQVGHGTSVVVGPWRGEVGWEVLYWIPFLRWLREKGLSPERTVAVSRGGPRSWYRGVADRYVDISELPEEWRHRSVDDGTQKQRKMDPHDEAAARHVANEIGLGEFVHVHPSVMYRMLQPYWTGIAPVDYLHRLTVVEPFTPPPLPEDVRLPERFVAVKFYDSRAFRLKEATMAWGRQTLETLARDIDVVLLNPAQAADDHPPLTLERSPRIHTIDPMQWGDRNLEVQTAIVARAAGLVGTYGGFSYLGPLLGVPTVALYANADAILGHHLELAREMFDRLRPGLYTALHLEHLQMLRLDFSRR